MGKCSFCKADKLDDQLKQIGILYACKPCWKNHPILVAVRNEQDRIDPSLHCGCGGDCPECPRCDEDTKVSEEFIHEDWDALSGCKCWDCDETCVDYYRCVKDLRAEGYDI